MLRDVRTEPLTAILAGLAAAFAPSAALAQPEATTVSILALGEQAVPAAQLTEVRMGLRRGVRGVEGLRFVYPGEMIARRDAPPELPEALAELENLAERLGEDPPEDVERTAGQILAILEANLDLVARSALVEAYMVLGIAQCEQRKVAACEASFQHVLRFRETAEYDGDRFPPEYAARFEDTRMSLLADGARSALEVTTTPAGAEVFVDGRSLGPSPVRAEGLLIGEHYVTVKALGFLEAVVRATVQPEENGRVDVHLEPAPRALFLSQAIPRVREELGNPRIGEAIQSLESVIPVDQVVLASVDREGRGLAVDVYVYDFRTRFLLAEEHEVAATGPGFADHLERLAHRLYESVDLRGNIVAPEIEVAADDSGDIWEQWWFWTAVGVVLASGAVTVVALMPSDPEVPAGFTRVSGVVQ